MSEYRTKTNAHVYTVCVCYSYSCQNIQIKTFKVSVII